MSPPLNARRSLQFTLRSLIVVIIVCALALTWWRQWRMSSEIADLREKLVWEENHRAFYQVMAQLDPKYEKQKLTLEWAGRDWPTSLRRLRLDGVKGKLEVWLFDLHVTGPVPGTGETLAVTMKDGKVMDLVLRRCAWSYEMHDAAFEDGNGDGRLDLVFHCRPGLWSGNEPPYDVVYEITTYGFFHELEK